ncbi:MAG: hypothetical protein ABIJ48_11035 [Actinomycetota bacterium]
MRKFRAFLFDKFVAPTWMLLMACAMGAAVGFGAAAVIYFGAEFLARVFNDLRSLEGGLEVDLYKEAFGRGVTMMGLFVGVLGAVVWGRKSTGRWWNWHWSSEREEEERVRRFRN